MQSDKLTDAQRSAVRKYELWKGLLEHLYVAANSMEQAIVQGERQCDTGYRATMARFTEEIRQCQSRIAAIRSEFPTIETLIIRQFLEDTGADDDGILPDMME